MPHHGCAPWPSSPNRSCIACGACVETCARGAIALEETAVIDASVCTGCGLCVIDRAYGALALVEI